MERQNERDVILSYTNLWFRTSEWSMERFGSELLAPALAARQLIEPLGEPGSGDEYLRARRAWGQRINRIFNGTQPFPLEWRAVWLQCLPEEHSRPAWRDCLALFDVVDLRVPKFSPSPVPAVPSRLGDVTREFGEFLSASAPAHNGRYDRGDDPVAVDKMLAEGTDVVLALISELVAIAAGTGRTIPALQGLVDKAAGGAHAAQ